jgi:hypothetical protein
MNNDKLRSFALWLSVAASITGIIGFYWSWKDRQKTATAANTN